MLDKDAQFKLFHLLTDPDSKFGVVKEQLIDGYKAYKTFGLRE
jgi:hypothetical protein